jgi:hypothetical protein
MPSPFPGMNPYLEQDALWQDFHLAFLPALRERLVPQVVPKYIVLLEEHIYVHDLPAEPRQFLGRADVAVAQTQEQPSGVSASTVLVAPTRVELLDEDVERVPFAEIRDRQTRELVTVIELLSPSNKRPGSDRDQYLAKRRALLSSHAHLVEIDLLRGGHPMPLAHRPPCAYSILVSRAEQRRAADFWPIALRQRLPEVPIPLRASDSDARVDLQDLLHRIYDAAGYEHFIYAGLPAPALSPEDADWARSLVPVTG